MYYLLAYCLWWLILCINLTGPQGCLDIWSNIILGVSMRGFLLPSEWNLHHWLSSFSGLWTQAWTIFLVFLGLQSAKYRPWNFLASIRHEPIPYNKSLDISRDISYWLCFLENPNTLPISPTGVEAVLPHFQVIISLVFLLPLPNPFSRNWVCHSPA